MSGQKQRSHQHGEGLCQGRGPWAWGGRAESRRGRELPALQAEPCHFKPCSNACKEARTSGTRAELAWALCGFRCSEDPSEEAQRHQGAASAHMPLKGQLSKGQLFEGDFKRYLVFLPVEEVRTHR